MSDTIEFRKAQMSAVIEMYESLQQAIRDAGGDLGDWDKLKHFTIEDLIHTLAVNGVRFYNINLPQ